MTSTQQRAELHRQIWQIANEVRGSVDGWDFKQYVLGTLFYRFISENFSSYIEAGDESVMGGMAKAPETFDLAKFQENAKFLAESANKPWAHFADKNQLGEATDAVWVNATEFKAETENFQKVTAELNKTAQNATTLEEILPAFKPVGDSCQSCHEDFKKKD